MSRQDFDHGGIFFKLLSSTNWVRNPARKQSFIRPIIYKVLYIPGG